MFGSESLVCVRSYQLAFFKVKREAAKPLFVAKTWRSVCHLCQTTPTKLRAFRTVPYFPYDSVCGFGWDVPWMLSSWRCGGCSGTDQLWTRPNSEEPICFLSITPCSSSPTPHPTAHPTVKITGNAYRKHQRRSNLAMSTERCVRDQPYGGTIVMWL